MSLQILEIRRGGQTLALTNAELAEISLLTGVNNLLQTDESLTEKLKSDTKFKKLSGDLIRLFIYSVENEYSVTENTVKVFIEKVFTPISQNKDWEIKVDLSCIDKLSSRFSLDEIKQGLVQYIWEKRIKLMKILEYRGAINRKMFTLNDHWIKAKLNSSAVGLYYISLFLNGKMSKSLVNTYFDNINTCEIKKKDIKLCNLYLRLNYKLIFQFLTVSEIKMLGVDDLKLIYSFWLMRSYTLFENDGSPLGNILSGFVPISEKELNTKLNQLRLKSSGNSAKDVLIKNLMSRCESLTQVDFFSIEDCQLLIDLKNLEDKFKNLGKFDLNLIDRIPKGNKAQQ